MAFDIRPTRLHRRSRLPAIAAAALGICLVAFALATARLTPTLAPVSPSASSSDPIRVPDVAVASLAPRALPPAGAIDCHDLAEGDCADVVRAAADALPVNAPAIISIGVWSSILCGDDFACPRHRFDGYRPLGSAVIAFGPRQPVAWINVATPTADERRVERSARPVAWIVDWRS